ncbi:hypothetical protein [Marinobacterium sediminicola]|uniref:DUF945 domain-containing protein n=1 Tax=Marinobacterium sediminicola TaxID=518898 RepID=A0ABY1S0E4_9GAMM|nr:hypothetical protein [Marinobacterium sediminicola]ULG69598.1 hypothetical protein LN244_01930 [Marinobacterium sediminicola]SMR74674.1 hypothetical protein SAMN04487964_107138 [Marinobacterium sediminicola]
MRKLGSLLGILVLATAAAYGVYWYQVKSKVDELVQQLSPFASIQYGAIYAHPDGTVGVNALSIAPHQVHSPVEIEQVRVQAGGPLALIFGADEPPAELFVSLKRVEQSLESALFHDLQKQMDLARESNPLYVSPAALGCGSIRQFDVSTTRMMGYRDLVMDLDLHYQGDENARKIRFEAQVDIDKMGDTRLEMVFSADPAQLKNPMMATGSARLEKLSVDYRDRGYNQRQVNLCAREAEMRPADYRAHHLELFKRWLYTNGIELPAGWLEAYADFQQEGSSFTLSMNPVGGFGSAELMMMQDPRYLIEKLNPSVKVNDAPLNLDGVKWDELVMQFALAGSGSRVARESEQVSVEQPAEVMEVPVESRVETAAVGRLEEPARPAIQKPVAKRFRETPVEQLGDHIGANVRIFTYFGNDVEGRLVAVEQHGVRVLQRLEQGMAEYPLDYKRIEQVEVYR